MASKIQSDMMTYFVHNALKEVGHFESHPNFNDSVTKISNLFPPNVVIENDLSVLRQKIAPILETDPSNQNLIETVDHIHKRALQTLAFTPLLNHISEGPPSEDFHLKSISEKIRTIPEDEIEPFITHAITLLKIIKNMDLASQDRMISHLKGIPNKDRKAFVSYSSRINTEKLSAESFLKILYLLEVLPLHRRIELTELIVQLPIKEMDENQLVRLYSSFDIRTVDIFGKNFKGVLQIIDNIKSSQSQLSLIQMFTGKVVHPFVIGKILPLINKGVSDPDQLTIIEILLDLSMEKVRYVSDLALRSFPEKMSDSDRVSIIQNLSLMSEADLNAAWA